MTYFWILLLAILATKAPLFIYAVSLSVAGIPHVFREYDYLRGRIPETGWSPLWILPIVGIVFLRVTATFNPTLSSDLLILELLLGGISLVFAASIMGVSGWIAAVILGVVALAVYYPLESILVFAFLHNGAAIFLVRTAERLPRRLLFALAISPVVFILSGNAPDALAWYSLPGVGARNFLHVYLPEFLYGTRLGWRLFALAAYLQVVHYYCVLGFLPKTRRSLPKEVVIALSLVMIGAFSLDFLATRRIYSFLAGFHAWFEWPALLVIGQSTNPRWKLLNAKNLSSTAISPASGEALR